MTCYWLKTAVSKKVYGVTRDSIKAMRKKIWLYQYVEIQSIFKWMNGISTADGTEFLRSTKKNMWLKD